MTRPYRISPEAKERQRQKISAACRRALNDPLKLSLIRLHSERRKQTEETKAKLREIALTRNSSINRKISAGLVRFWATNPDAKAIKSAEAKAHADPDSLRERAALQERDIRGRFI